MSLFLSRLQLNPLSVAAIKLVGNPNQLHRVLYRLFEQKDAERILFRVDTDLHRPVVLLQSKTEPDWNHLDLKSTDLLAPPATKIFLPSFVIGQEFTFRLLARPTKRIRRNAEETYKRTDIRSDEERLNWLHRKGADAGFVVSTCGLTNYSFSAIHPENSHKPSERRRGTTFAATRFDGSLVVADAEKLALAVANGIGTQKAFGFGLLSLARE